MSITRQEIEIANRFFQAVEFLKSNGSINSLRQITERYGLNYGNVHTMMTKPETSRIKLGLLASLCKDYGISAEWVILGYGKMLVKRRMS